jgi:hypothetical protein
MIKKTARKPRGPASIAVVEDTDLDTVETGEEANGSQPDSQAIASKPRRTTKSKLDQTASEHFGVSDIKKAAAFANSIGGLDKAIAVLQILKVAKEVQ